MSFRRTSLLGLLVLLPVVPAAQAGPLTEVGCTAAPVANEWTDPSERCMLAKDEEDWIHCHLLPLVEELPQDLQSQVYHFEDAFLSDVRFYKCYVTHTVNEAYDQYAHPVVEDAWCAAVGRPTDPACPQEGAWQLVQQEVCATYWSVLHERC